VRQESDLSSPDYQGDLGGARLR